MMVQGERESEPLQETAHVTAHVTAHETAHETTTVGNGEDAPGAEARGDGDGGGGERRRRRRGRRGGRRNRRDREDAFPPSSDGDAMEAEAQSPAEEPAREAEPSQPFHQSAAEAVSEPPPPRPEPPAPEPPPVETGVSEMRRRRSTVREPASISVASEPSAPHEPVAAASSEPPQPVVISPTEGEDADRPRRSGWWSRRMLGKS
jgi:ribonuclease E